MLRINDEAPNFTAETSQGTINFHEWIGDGWAILFSHPKDFTPVCTTELGYMAGLQPEFEKRNCKIIGLSVDPVSSHSKWAVDIEETQGHKVNYPMIGDPRTQDRQALRHAARRSRRHCEGRTAATNATVRTVFVVGPDKKIKLMLSYPMSTGRNFDEVLRVVDSMQLTAKHKVATPVNWKPGDDVIIAGSVSDEEAKKKYPQGWKSPRPYLRIGQPRRKIAGDRRCAVILKQFYLPCLAHASYLIGDEATGTAAVVDPQRDMDQYIAFAAEHSLRSSTSSSPISTPTSSPAISSCAIASAPQFISAPRPKRHTRSRLFDDGDVLEFGRVRLKVLETPGHTPESISILVYDLERQRYRSPTPSSPATRCSSATSAGPICARHSAGPPRNSAACSSIRCTTKLLALPDESLVYPAHGAGSLCGKALSKETVSTLGEQRRTNYALQPMSKEAFIERGHGRSARSPRLLHL